MFVVDVGERSPVRFFWSEFLATDPEVRVQFPALPDFLRSSELEEIIAAPV
jgi:hypothetical protein